jgi:hypothetical protein
MEISRNLAIIQATEFTLLRGWWGLGEGPFMKKMKKMKKPLAPSPQPF